VRELLIMVVQFVVVFAAVFFGMFFGTVAAIKTGGKMHRRFLPNCYGACGGSATYRARFVNSCAACIPLLETRHTEMNAYGVPQPALVWKPITLRMYVTYAVYVVVGGILRAVLGVNPRGKRQTDYPGLLANRCLGRVWR